MGVPYTSATGVGVDTGLTLGGGVLVLVPVAPHAANKRRQASSTIRRRIEVEVGYMRIWIISMRMITLPSPHTKWRSTRGMKHASAARSFYAKDQSMIHQA